MVEVLIVDCVTKVVVIPVVVDVVVVVTVLAHGALHCLGHNAVSEGSVHVRIAHSRGSVIVEVQSKN